MKLPIITNFFFIVCLWANFNCQGQVIAVDNGYHYIQQGAEQEWNEFNSLVPIKQYRIEFETKHNKYEHCLQLRQYDVKTSWKVMVNEVQVGILSVDENDKQVYYSIEPGLLKTGRNIITLIPEESSDDILFGELYLHNRSLQEVLNEGQLNVNILEGSDHSFIPSRLTIINKKMILQSVGGKSNDTLAVRPGIIYTSTGRITIGLPAGEYRLYATRGFEYGVDSTDIRINSGDTIHTSLHLLREVETPGLVSSDTHIHTLTYSNHGDATLKERVITIAGEGIEMPVITEHNLSVNIASLADSMGLLGYFTPVQGTEMTTSFGHFNLFPLENSNVPDFDVKNWKEVKSNIQKDPSIKAVILNHARDIHKNFRPIDSSHMISKIGFQPEEWPFPANAMELVNSGSTQTDPLQLTFDWFDLLKKGYKIAGIGASDSHDVSRFLIGQSRTYIKSNDSNVGKITTTKVIDDLVAGKTMVSFGLLTEIKVNDKGEAGDTMMIRGRARVKVKVSGPSWARAEKLTIYVNGLPYKVISINNSGKKGIKWEGEVKLPSIKGNSFIVAIAEGPDDHLVYWPISKPYQPTSSHWNGSLLGISGVVWLKE